jgi:TetR/AcrR family transcriptional regulator, mexJK operon transcriptional repressor
VGILAKSTTDRGRADEDTRSARKRRVITEAATEAFLRNGYLGTSVDEIAAAAGVSKQTVYKHFADKEGLFTEIVLGTIDQVGEPFFSEIGSLEEPKNPEDLETDLRELARRLVAIVREPRLLQLRRLVIAEASRFPELGRAYYERGPGRTVHTLASWFQRLAERGHLQLDEAVLAAEQFNWLVLAIPLNRAMLTGVEEVPPADLERYSDEAVRVFLAAYRPT